MRRSRSKLYEKWSMEPHMRVVDLETIAQPVFAINIPKTCFQEGGGEEPDHFLLLKDRIYEWPSIFNSGEWISKNEPRKSKKRKLSSP